jgi:hypothetical protein
MPIINLLVGSPSAPADSGPLSVDSATSNQGGNACWTGVLVRC